MLPVARTKHMSKISILNPELLQNMTAKVFKKYCCDIYSDFLIELGMNSEDKSICIKAAVLLSWL
jgi:hypothetical protein